MYPGSSEPIFKHLTDFESSRRYAPAGALRMRGAAGFDLPRRENRTSTVPGGHYTKPLVRAPFVRPSQREEPPEAHPVLLAMNLG